MAVVEFTGVFRLVQNFTDNSDLLARAVSSVKIGPVDPNADSGEHPSPSASTAEPGDQPGMAISTAAGFSLNTAAGDFGARDLLFALRRRDQAAGADTRPQDHGPFLGRVYARATSSCRN